MNLSSSVLKERAKAHLKNNYGNAILVYLIFSVIPSVVAGAGAVTSFSQMVPSMLEGNVTNFNVTVSPISSIGSIASILIVGPLTVGMATFFLNIADCKNAQINDLFSQFKNFVNTFLYSLLVDIFIFLWSLLFIIPGIIASFSYAMTPYILSEHPEIKAMDAIKMSKEMMKGHKGEYFILQLSFIGWFILCIFTAGIGFFFLSPYISAANAEFFNEVSGKNIQKAQAQQNDQQFGGFNNGTTENNGFNGFENNYTVPNETATPSQGSFNEDGNSGYYNTGDNRD